MNMIFLITQDDDSDGKMPPTCKDTKYQIEKSKIGLDLN